MNRMWTDQSYEDFSKGCFGNAGQNLYVSKAGVLQRIFQYDLNHNGYLDLVFPCTQNHHEAMPSYVYAQDGSRTELPAQGGADGLAIDLNGNGYQDLIIANRYDAAQHFASADIYFGSELPYSEKYHLRLPAPFAMSVTAGHFNNGKTMAIAFAQPVYKNVRIFYPTELGCYEWMKFVDLNIDCDSMTATDLDDDGYDELIVRKACASDIRIYWGGKDGIHLDNSSVFHDLTRPDEYDYAPLPNLPECPEGFKFDSKRRIQVVEIQGQKYISLITGKKVILFTCTPNRQLRRAMEFDTPFATAVLAQDLTGNGIEDIIVTAAHPASKGSRVYWGTAAGYDEQNITDVPTQNAVDAAVLKDKSVIFCQGAVGTSYTSDSLVFQFDDHRQATLIDRLQGEFAKRVFSIDNPQTPEQIFIVNTYNHSAIGAGLSPIYWGSKDGYSKSNVTMVPCRCGVETISADLNDDGWAELMICNNAEEAPHLNYGHDIHYFNERGFVPDKSQRLPNNLGWAATVADFDHDGYLEIATVADNYDSIKLFRCVGDDFIELYTVPLNCGNHARWLTAADLNHNGYLDLIIPCNRTERSVILWGSEHGFSMDNSQYLAVYQGACARCADLNHNGYLDVLIGTHVDLPGNGVLHDRQPQHSFLHIYWNGPEGISEFRKTVLRTDAADSIAIGDFNNDGYLDVFCGSYHGGKDRDVMSFLYWNRQGQFHEADRKLLYTHSAAGCMACDFNEDGKVDLAVSNHKFWGNHENDSEIWWNGEDGFDHRNTTKLPATGPHGLSAVEPGNQATRGPEEYYTSTVFPLSGQFLVRADMKGEVPAKTWVKIRFRFAESKDELAQATWTAFQDFGPCKGTGRFAQYQLALGAVNGGRSPRIKAIEITVSDTRNN